MLIFSLCNTFWRKIFQNYSLSEPRFAILWTLKSNIQKLRWPWRLTELFLYYTMYFFSITAHFLNITVHFFNNVAHFSNKTAHFLNTSTHFLHNIAYFLNITVHFLHNTAHFLNTSTPFLHNIAYFLNKTVHFLHNTAHFLNVTAHFLGMGVGYKVPPSKSPKQKMTYQWNFSHKSMYLLFPLFVCFRVLFCVMWYGYDVISMISPCKLRKLDIALVYQKSFGIAYIFAIYVFLVSHCYTWNKKAVNNQ